jgi:hypothetical protein
MLSAIFFYYANRQNALIRSKAISSLFSPIGLLMLGGSAAKDMLGD